MKHAVTPQTLRLTILPTVTRVREGPPGPYLNLFPDDEVPDEKRIYSTAKPSDLKKAIDVLKAVAGAKVVWELLYAILQALDE